MSADTDKSLQLYWGQVFNTDMDSMYQHIAQFLVSKHLLLRKRNAK